MPHDPTLVCVYIEARQFLISLVKKASLADMELTK